jgi:hypothetical protein
LLHHCITYFGTPASETLSLLGISMTELMSFNMDLPPFIPIKFSL